MAVSKAIHTLGLQWREFNKWYIDDRRSIIITDGVDKALHQLREVVRETLAAEAATKHPEHAPIQGGLHEDSWRLWRRWHASGNRMAPHLATVLAHAGMFAPRAKYDTRAIEKNSEDPNEQELFMDICPRCNKGEVETAQHRYLHCEHWNLIRQGFMTHSELQAVEKAPP